MKKIHYPLLLLTIILLLCSCNSEKPVSNEVNVDPLEAYSTNDAVTILPGSEPVFSVDSGFYEEEFELSISSSKGLRIYYTTDGSLPTNQSIEMNNASPLKVTDQSLNENLYSMIGGTTTGTFYAPTILIDKATIIRAIAYDDEGNVSSVVTKTYFVGFQDKADYYNKVSVISLVTAPDNLFDYDTGIYVTGAVYDNWLGSNEFNPTIKYWHQPANYKSSGEEWEREAHLDFFNENGAIAFSQEIGIRLRGGASRAFLQKSFNIYARSEYGDKRINYELFTGLTSEYDGSLINSYKSFMLRNGGNDTELTKIREVLVHQLSSDLDISVQASRPAIVFLNGEFWGLYNVQERYSAEYIESHYGVDKDDVVIVKKDEIDEGNEEDIELYQSMIAYAVRNNLTDPLKYDEFCKMMDIESFIDYISAEIFVGNKDWGSNNVMLWRSRTVDTVGNNPYADGKWRWMLYDTEYSMGLSYENSLAYDANYNPSSYENNTFGTVVNPSSSIGTLFCSLIKNDTFYAQFTATFMDIANTTFNKDTVNHLLNEYADSYRPMMVDTLLRYRDLSEEEAALQFDYEVNKIRDFFLKRYDYITGELITLFPN